MIYSRMVRIMTFTQAQVKAVAEILKKKFQNLSALELIDLAYTILQAAEDAK